MKPKHKKAYTRHREKGTALGREIIAGLKDLTETLAAGIPLEQKYTVHTIEVPDPGEYDARKIKALRARMGLSQALFARLIGASHILVQKWEGGDRHPDGMTRRLLDDMSADPNRWLSRLLKHRKAG